MNFNENFSLPPLKLVLISSEKSPVTTGQLAESKIAEFLGARSLSSNTKKAYRRQLTKFLAWAGCHWLEVTPRQAIAYKGYLLGQNLAASSINNALVALMSFYDWFCHTHGAVLNPMKGIELVKVAAPIARDLSETEVLALFEAISGETFRRDRAILSVLSHGLRASEVVGLNVGDYDGIRLFIRQAKGDSTGSVPLSSQTRTNIDLYLEERQGDEKLNNDSPLFLSCGRNSQGKRLGYQGLYYLITELGERAGIPNVTPHRLRHYFASKMLMLGMDGLHVRELTRHKSEASFKRYIQGVKQQAAEHAFFDTIKENQPR